MREADAVVVGAGPSGAVTAILLARAGHRVTVVDRARFPRDKACGEGLMPPGVALLRRLGLLDAVRATGAPPLSGVTYTTAAGGPAAFAPFPAPPGGGDSWGLGVRRTTFDSALVAALAAEPRISLLSGVRATHLLRGPGGRVSGVATGAGPVEGQVTVAADGLHSRLRANAGWTGPAALPGRYGLVGHWRTAGPPLPGIRVTLGRDHEWYEAPVAGGETLVSVLGTARVVGAASRDYAAAARAALPHLRAAEPTAAPRAAGAFRQRPRQLAGGGLFLVGDAAGYDDPATGEGLAVGMLQAEGLAAVLAPLLDERADPARAADAYARRCQRLRRDRARVTGLALWLGAHPRRSARVVARAAGRPAALSRLLGINCGYWGFGALRPQDWWTLLGP
ncbi:MAG TPA: NAD(P)/FAD-dependent oxidoreductase [Candidatus Dormibacteraeota bacterium]|nr:NAD(P)/FAD-dependent oxidoreductase [Candidatus Dormibacteraeota bacterium]